MSGWLSAVVAVELEGRRVEEREVVVVLVRVLTLGRDRLWSSVDMLSLLASVPLRVVGESDMHGTEVHSSMGGSVVKFIHGASGPHREG
jgi:hypothetical protein